MARFVVGAAFGVLVGLVAGAALGVRADDVEAAALEAGVDPQDLQGAVNSTGISARDYLAAVGELGEPDPQPPAARSSPRGECVIWHESRNVPTAVNPRSGAAGLGQFLPSTWRTTPQGQAGYSVFNAAANRAAVEWMLAVGRGREFDVVRLGYC